MINVPQISTDHPPSVRYGIRFGEKNVKTCMAPALLCLTYQCGEKTKKKLTINKKTSKCGKCYGRSITFKPTYSRGGEFVDYKWRGDIGQWSVLL